MHNTVMHDSIGWGYHTIEKMMGKGGLPLKNEEALVVGVVNLKFCHKKPLKHIDPKL